MANHRYLVGESVILEPSSKAAFLRAGGAYIVKAQLPMLGTAFQYRIKGDLEVHERVVLEHHLSRAAVQPIFSAISQSPGGANTAVHTPSISARREQLARRK